MHHSVTILGHVGRNPEQRYLPDGTACTTFTVASNKQWTDSSGQKQKKTTWWRVTAWRKLAETCGTFVRTGMLVYIEGEMEPDENGGPRLWQASDGTWRASYEVRASLVKFLSRVDDSTTSGPALSELPDDNSEEIPF